MKVSLSLVAAILLAVLMLAGCSRGIEGEWVVPGQPDASLTFKDGWMKRGMEKAKYEIRDKATLAIINPEDASEVTLVKMKLDGDSLILDNRAYVRKGSRLEREQSRVHGTD
jgi:hypothetical protein